MRPREVLMPSCSSCSSSASTSGTAIGGAFDLALLDQRPAIIILEITGDGVKEAFRNEAGGHRWQRTPPTEKRGRVQTSTITVAVLDPIESRDIEIGGGDIEWEAFRGSGKGGQKRNKTASAVRITHKPTGTVIRYESERSQSQNLRVAKAILAARLRQASEASASSSQSADRKAQVGTGMRGDKRRTIRVRDDRVTDHSTGRTMSCKAYLRGELEPLNQ
jgi:peptide chain release factor 1